MHALRSLLAGLLLAIPAAGTSAATAPARNLTFSAHCFSNVPKCSDSISDIVTEKFMARFPSDKWRIVIFSEAHHYSDGTAVAFSLAGVAPRTLAADGKLFTQFPANRFTRSFKTDGSVSTREVHRLELQLLRSAVEDLMAECDRQPRCDVYTPQR